jgi:hypothetical protein
MTHRLTYPLFVKSKDDKSIDVIRRGDRREWLYYERIDIESDNYECWDYTGVRFQMVWSDDGLPAPVVVDQTPHADELRIALLEYARLFGAETSESQTDPLQMLEDIQQHLRKNKFLHRSVMKVKWALQQSWRHLHGK